MASNPGRSEFQEQLRTTFTIRLSETAAVPLELTDVMNHRFSADLESFSLLFRGPLIPLLPQRTYRLEHEQLGPQELFLVPVGPRDGTMQYEAVFNRFLKEP
jgi:hypothetical protein